MNKTFAAALFALVLPTAACGTVESPDDMMDPDMMEEMTGEQMPDPEQPKPQPGTVDTLYGSNGYMKLDGVLGFPSHVALQGDKLLVCSVANFGGINRTVLTRIGFDGAVDDTFGVENGRMEFGDNSYCHGLRVRPDGSIVIFVKSGASAFFRLTKDGSLVDHINTASVTAMNLTADNKLLAAGTTAGGGFSARDAEAPLDVASTPALTGKVARSFFINGKHAIAGVFTNGGSGWSLLVEEAEGTIPMPTKIASVGNALKEDFMLDAVQLADGSIVAVGSADSDMDAVVGRLAPGADPILQVRDIGLTSSFRRVILDGADHVLALGSTSDAGGTKIVYQRVATATLAVDASYAGGGTMIVPGYQGSGDVTGAVHYNGATYILTSYNVETSTPGSALLKIHE